MSSNQSPTQPGPQQGGAADLSRVPAAQPRFHRFRLGDIECIALSDGSIPPAKPVRARRILPGAGRPRADAASIVLLAGPLAGGGGVVLMDTGFGAGAAFGGQPMPFVGRLPESLAGAGVEPEDISAVLISHVHPDHVSGRYRGDGAQTCLNATYPVGAEELAFWSREPLDLSQAASPPPYERPPSSKAYFSGEKQFEQILIRPAQYWAQREVAMPTGRRVIAVDPDARIPAMADGSSLGYGTLVWATGACHAG